MHFGQTSAIRCHYDQAARFASQHFIENKPKTGMSVLGSFQKSNGAKIETNQSSYVEIFDRYRQTIHKFWIHIGDHEKRNNTRTTFSSETQMQQVGSGQMHVHPDMYQLRIHGGQPWESPSSRQVNQRNTWGRNR